MTTNRFFPFHLLCYTCIAFRIKSNSETCALRPSSIVLGDLATYDRLSIFFSSDIYSVWKSRLQLSDVALACENPGCPSIAKNNPSMQGVAVSISTRGRFFIRSDNL